MNIQKAKTIYCIAVDPDPIDGGAGSALWTSNREQTDRMFQQMRIDHRRDGDTLIRFDLQVPATADEAACLELANAAAWEQNYQEIRRLTVAVEH